LREQRAGPADMAELDLNLRRCGCRRQRHCKCDCEQSSCRAHAYSPRAFAVSPPIVATGAAVSFLFWFIHAKRRDSRKGMILPQVRLVVVCAWGEQGGADPHSMQ
jgi:hypothetical protein